MSYNIEGDPLIVVIKAITEQGQFFLARIFHTSVQNSCRKTVPRHTLYLADVFIFNKVL